MRPLLIAPVLALAWGLNWPAVKIALGVFPPFTLRWVGLGLGGFLLMMLAWAQKRRLRPAPGAWPGIVMGGLLTVALFNMSTAMAQLNTSTSRAAVLTFTMPMMSAVLARFWLGEQLDRRQMLALGLGMAGIALLALPVLQALRSGGVDARALKGLGFPLLAALGWACSTVLAKRWPAPGDRMVLTAWQLLLGAACILMASRLTDEAFPPWPLPPRVLAAMIFHILPATALAYWLWTLLSDQVGASVSSMTTLLVPVVGVLGAMGLVGDRPSTIDWLGFALVLGGAALVLRQLWRKS